MTLKISREDFGAPPPAASFLDSRHGFLRAAGPTVGDLLGQRDDGLPTLVHTHPEQTVRQAIALLREYSVRQMPVRKPEPPALPGRILGTVHERALADRLPAAPPLRPRPGGGRCSGRGLSNASGTVGGGERAIL